jgi:hypothetical protein
VKFYVLLASLALVACSKDKVAFDTLETARTQAKANAEYNALKFRAESPRYTNAAIEMQGDSSQTPECPQGDGWASGKLVNKEDPSKFMAIKCSTVSGSIGCMEQTEFSKKPYAAEDGQCQATTKVPHPIPKIAK